MSFSDDFLAEVQRIVAEISRQDIEAMADLLATVRDRGGRLFILGVGGSAASASHAVNDFRKIAVLEAYAPTDNVSELTARTNDDGWASVFAAWLQGSHLNNKDALLILSVGGGDAQRNVSPNLVEAMKLAKSVGAAVLGIVGRDGGYTRQVADASVVVPTVHPSRITPHTESFHSVVCHLLVSHPKLQKAATKWESTKP
jgi:D-sedoheptulose 7-phosphate isomerase